MRYWQRYLLREVWFINDTGLALPKTRKRISPRNTRERPVGPLLFASWRRCGKSGMRGTSRRFWRQRPDFGSSDGALSVLHAIYLSPLNA
jgi:hypothetical protein